MFFLNYVALLNLTFSEKNTDQVKMNEMKWNQVTECFYCCK